jgi:hypothetical protein
MPEIGTSSSMSGDGKRSVGLRPQATAVSAFARIGHTGPCCCVYAEGVILLNQKRLRADLGHEHEWELDAMFRILWHR